MCVYDCDPYPKKTERSVIQPGDGRVYSKDVLENDDGDEDDDDTNDGDTKSLRQQLVRNLGSTN